MKTTLDLPETLVRELQQRAQQAGQDLTQAATDLLWQWGDEFDGKPPDGIGTDDNGRSRFADLGAERGVEIH